MAGRLYRMAKVVSANPKSWGIVDANEISGFKRVAKLSDLYSIAECILSSSYGDGVTDGADAVGQIWHVSETNGDYKLINWANRKSAAGWEKVLTDDEILTGVGNEITPILEELKEKDKTLENNLNSFKTDSDAKFESFNLWSGVVADKLNTFGKPNGFATLDTKGFVPLSQLGNLDTTLFEVVTELPSTIATIKKHIYLKAAGTTGDKNNYAEYIYTGDLTATYDATKWEKLGEVAAKTNLSEYYKKTEVYNKTEINDKVSNINNSINAQKVKLDGIEVNANNYDHPSYTSTPTKALYKINVDGFGHVSGYAEVTKADITALGIPGSAPTVDAAMSDTSTNAVQNKVIKQAIDDVESVAMQAVDDISVIQDDYYNSKNLVALTDTELNEILK